MGLICLPSDLYAPERASEKGLNLNHAKQTETIANLSTATWGHCGHSTMNILKS